MCNLLADRAKSIGLPAEALEAGLLLPDHAGEYFATLGPDGRPVVLNADLNAAQNLQRRLWTRYTEPVRVPAVRTSRPGMDPIYHPDRDGKRLRGGLAAILGNSGHARFEPVDGTSGFEILPESPNSWKKAVGASQPAAGDEEDPEQATADSEHRNLFRDPSGLVLPADRWFTTREFWNHVEKVVGKALAVADRQDTSPF